MVWQGIEWRCKHRPITCLLSGGGIRRRAQEAAEPDSRSRPFAGKRDPPEEPPSEESYGVEGRSPGLWVIASVPAFPCFDMKRSDMFLEPPLAIYSCGGSAGITHRASPASRLSPAVMTDTGNLDGCIQHEELSRVKSDIKISLYAVIFKAIQSEISKIGREQGGAGAMNGLL